MPAGNRYEPEFEQWWKKNKQAILQVACSGELGLKLSELKERSAEIAHLSEEYSEYTSNELFLQNEYYRLQMEALEKEFFQKQLEYWNHHACLRLIYLHPIYLN